MEPAVDNDTIGERCTDSFEPTDEEIQEIHKELGPDAVEAFMEAQRAAGNGERVAPVIAGVAVAAIAWCLSGAIGSLPTSALDDYLNGDEDGDYIYNAALGCIAGNIGSKAMKLLPTSVKKKITKAAVRFIRDHM